MSLNIILNKTSSPKNRWRIVHGGMGIQGEPEHSPNRLFRIGHGPLVKDENGQLMYREEMALDVFFFESDAPLSVKKTVREWLVANGYTAWLCEHFNNLGPYSLQECANQTPKYN